MRITYFKCAITQSLRYFYPFKISILKGNTQLFAIYFFHYLHLLVFTSKICIALTARRSNNTFICMTVAYSCGCFLLFFLNCKWLWINKSIRTINEIILKSLRRQQPLTYLLTLFSKRSFTTTDFKVETQNTWYFVDIAYSRVSTAVCVAVITLYTVRWSTYGVFRRFSLVSFYFAAKFTFL